MGVTRRQFVQAFTIGPFFGGAAPASNGMPKRVLGRTGRQVSVLAMGCGSRFLMYKDEDKALEALNRALDLGINYLDTAYSYGRGLSEERVGKVMATRRKDVFLATKVPDRKGDAALRTIEGSLKRLRVDQVDLIHIHSLTGADDLAAIEAADGVLQALYKLRDQKVTRFIGITSHTDPAVLKTALERHDFDCTQMALNAAMAGMTSGPGGMVVNSGRQVSFERRALPVAVRKNLGVIAMKVFAQDALVGQASAEKLLGYALSLPVATAVVGMPRLELIEENAALARAFRPLPPEEMRSLSERLAGANKAALDSWFARHLDA